MSTCRHVSVSMSVCTPVCNFQCIFVPVFICKYVFYVSVYTYGHKCMDKSTYPRTGLKVERYKHTKGFLKL